MEQKVLLDDVTAKNYKCPVGQESVYHCKLERKHYSASGERLSAPYVAKFEPVNFETSIHKSLQSMGYDVVILHDPRKWAQKQERKLKPRQNQLNRNNMGTPYKSETIIKG